MKGYRGSPPKDRGARGPTIASPGCGQCASEPMVAKVKNENLKPKQFCHCRRRAAGCQPEHDAGQVSAVLGSTQERRGGNKRGTYLGQKFLSPGNNRTLWLHCSRAAQASDRSPGPLGCGTGPKRRGVDGISSCKVPRAPRPTGVRHLPNMPSLSKETLGCSGLRDARSGESAFLTPGGRGAPLPTGLL